MCALLLCVIIYRHTKGISFLVHPVVYRNFECVLVWCVAGWQFIVNVSTDIDRITSDKYSGRCKHDHQTGPPLHFTAPMCNCSFIFSSRHIYLCLSVCSLCVFVSYCIAVVLLLAPWDGPNGIKKSLILRTLSFSVLWHCWLGHLTGKNSSPIWPIKCLVGR